MEKRRSPALEALIVSSDAQVLETLTKALVRLEIESSKCDGTTASEFIGKRKFDAILLDCDVDRNGRALLDEIRKSRSNRTSTVLALADASSQATELLKLGANLVVTKPVTHQLAWKTLRATLGVMEQERRRYFRHTLGVEVDIATTDGNQCNALATNLSEGGMALKFDPSSPCAIRVQPGTMGNVRFCLPSGNSDWISAKVSFAWVDSEGRAGLRFEIVDPDSMTSMESWRKSNFESDR
jgi:CheY-like chemotaxis protein